jgi:hypothetical protein
MPTTVTDRQLSGGDWAVYLSEQTAQGSVNATPEWSAERRTEGRIKSVPSYTTSSEVSLDFNPSQQVQDGRESTGEISFELTKQKISRLFAAIYGAETQVTETSTTIAATGTGFTSTDGSFADIEVGDYPYFSGLAAAANNKGYRVTAKADDDTITTYPAPAATAVAGPSVTVKCFKTTNANLPTYFSGQNRVIDESKVDDIDFQTFVDGLINAFSVEIGESGIITGSQTIQFARKLDGTGAVSGQTDAAATTDAPLSAVQNVANWYLNDVTALCELKSATISMSNENQRDQAAGCGDRYVRGSNPVITVEGVSRSSIANSMVIRDYFDNATRIGFAVELSHGGADRTVIVIPQTVVTAWDMPDGQNVIANNEFTLTAEKDADLGYSIAVFRNWS